MVSSLGVYLSKRVDGDDLWYFLAPVSEKKTIS